MEIRKLEKEEHVRTRALYETVFSEDEKRFVDYYYIWKIQGSQIYVAEDEKGIHGMVHLNPFCLSVNGELQTLHYIVAVATEKEYRHQGIMSRLLAAAEKDMAERGEKFTFLMPASEAIYRPFGYRFFSEQRCGVLRCAYADNENELCRPVSESEYDKLASFVNETLSRQYDVFVYRDAAYYERLCQEQQCQKGEVMVILRQTADGQEQIIGTFCTAREGTEAEDFSISSSIGVRELIVVPEYGKEAEAAILAWLHQQIRQDELPLSEQAPAASFEAPKSSGTELKIKVEGCNCDELLSEIYWKPLLMAKAPQGEVWQELWPKDRVFINEVV